MYRTLASLKLPSAAATGAEVAEIAACLAIGEADPVIVCGTALGARSVRRRRTVAVKKFAASGGVLAAATVSATAALITDAKATALVCGDRLQPDEDYRGVFSFAARHKLPILYLVSNSLTTGRRQELDLRTLYAEFGIPVFSVDANDAIAAYRVTTEALHNARHSRGPCVIEALTFGSKGISKPDTLELLRSYMERHGNWPV
jgi:TPP-dependent pyruvate/acetoin dehydrogenase alpha subunit